MKKIFAIFAMVLMLVATSCGNCQTKTEVVADSTAVEVVDSAAVEVVDSATIEVVEDAPADTVAE